MVPFVFCSYDFQLVGDKKYGSFVNGEWNGMIRELRDRVTKKIDCLTLIQYHKK